MLGISPNRLVIHQLVVNFEPTNRLDENPFGPHFSISR